MTENAKEINKALAYVKGLHAKRDGQQVLSAEAGDLVTRPLAEDMIVCYLVDLGNVFRYLQNCQLTEEGVSAAELHTIATRNLWRLIIEREMQVDQYQEIFAVTMGGDFEASVLLLDKLWDEVFRQFVKGDYAIAVPARSYLAFCDSKSKRGIQQLRQLIDTITRDGDHLISENIYVRRNGNLARLK